MNASCIVHQVLLLTEKPTQSSQLLLSSLARYIQSFLHGPGWLENSTSCKKNSIGATANPKNTNDILLHYTGIQYAHIYNVEFIYMNDAHHIQAYVFKVHAM